MATLPSLLPVRLSMYSQLNSPLFSDLPSTNSRRGIPTSEGYVPQARASPRRPLSLDPQSPLFYSPDCLFWILKVTEPERRDFQMRNGFFFHLLAYLDRFPPLSVPLPCRLPPTITLAIPCSDPSPLTYFLIIRRSVAPAKASFSQDSCVNACIAFWNLAIPFKDPSSSAFRLRRFTPPPRR